MIWNDKAFLISKFKYSENSIIADFFTENYGRVSGIIFGATSKKIKGYLQIGNLFQINFTLKNESKIGSIKAEIIDPLTPFFFNDKEKLHCITSAMSMIRLLTVENQISNDIFYSITSFYKLLRDEEWIKNYLFWELNLLKLTGYDLNLDKIVKTSVVDKKKEYYVENTYEKKIVPTFLIDRHLKDIKKQEILKGYNLISNYIEKNILSPNNINHPIPRVDFINLLKYC